jgi:hypothetical protein
LYLDEALHKEILIESLPPVDWKVNAEKFEFAILTGSSQFPSSFWNIKTRQPTMKQASQGGFCLLGF